MKAIIHLTPQIPHKISTGQAQDKYRTSTGQVPNKHRTSTEQAQDKYRTSTGQVPNKHRTSTEQAQDKLHTDNPNITQIVQVVGEKELSVKEMMNGVGLKGRNNFLNLYLNPAITEGYIRLLYPESPRHPRQKYLLTVKGMVLYNELKCCDSNSVKGRYAKNKYLYGFLGVPSLSSVWYAYGWVHFTSYI